jgi:hypothetical protein
MFNIQKYSNLQITIWKKLACSIRVEVIQFVDKLTFLSNYTDPKIFHQMNTLKDRFRKYIVPTIWIKGPSPTDPVYSKIRKTSILLARSAQL